MHKTLLVTTAAIALVASSAWARSNSSSNHESGAAAEAPGIPASSKSGSSSPPSMAADQTLAKAISTIERNNGGKVMEIRFHRGSGRTTYDAVVAKDGSLEHTRVDTLNGKLVTISSTETPEWMLSWEKRADVKSIAKAKVPLSKAIMTAEKAGQGPAVDAGLAKPLTASNEVLAYNVEIIRDGRPVRVAVDAITNEVIQDPSLFENWTPEGPPLERK